MNFLFGLILIGFGTYGMFRCVERFRSLNEMVDDLNAGRISEDQARSILNQKWFWKL
jgi:hypothetical protein